jgi:acyl carrier protein
MKKEEFLKELIEELELETVVTLDTNIKDMDEWDSMAAMILVGYVSDTFDVTLNDDDIRSLTTFRSLMDRIGEEKFV